MSFQSSCLETQLYFMFVMCFVTVKKRGDGPPVLLDFFPFRHEDHLAPQTHEIVADFWRIEQQKVDVHGQFGNIITLFKLYMLKWRCLEQRRNRQSAFLSSSGVAASCSASRSI